MLSPEEKAELEALRQEQGPMNQGGLSPAEKAELEQLRMEQDGPQQTKPEMTMGRALAENIPLGPTMLRKQDTGSFYDKPGEYGSGGTAQKLGDIGTVAGLGAAGATLGAGPVGLGLGLGALAGAGLEKSGVSPALREAGRQTVASEKIQLPFLPEFMLPPKFDAERLSKLPEGLRQPVAFAQEAPGQLKATVLESIPSALGGLASMFGMKAIKSGAGRMAKAPVDAPGAAGQLQRAGGEVTPAMVRAAQGKQGGIASGVESVTRANPLTSGMMQKIDKKNIGAIKKTLASEIPASEMTPQSAGESFGQTMEAFQKRRGGEVGAAKAKAQQIDAGDVGQIASKKIIAKLEAGKVPFGEKGFTPETMTGREKIGKATAEALVKVERDLKGATLAETVDYLDNFDEAFGGELATKYPGAAARAMRDARSIIKDTLVEAIGTKDKALATELRRADRQYSVSQPTAKKVLEKFRGETPMSELIKSTMGKAGAKGDKGLRRLQSTMTPEEFGKVQDSLVSEVIKSSTGNKGISLAKLETNLREMGENTKFLKPEHLATLKKVQDMMKAANVVELEMPNPPGTAARQTGNLATIGGTGLVGGALAGHPLPLLGYAGGSAASAAYMKLPMVQQALKRLMKPAAGKVAKGLKGFDSRGVGAGAAIGSAQAAQ